MSATSVGRSRIAHLIRVLAVPVVLIWVGLNVVTNVFVPPLEKVGEANTVGLSAHDAPAMIAMKRIGANFAEFDSDSNAMVVLEGDQPLGDDAHRYYDTLVAKLTADTDHVQHVTDFWSDPLTASGVQSVDGKAAYVQLYLQGNQGETRAIESVRAVRDIVAQTPPPPGLNVYVTGGAPLVSDQHHAGDKSVARVTAITLGVIALMLLVVYRSVFTMFLVMVMVFMELGAARGVVAFLANAGIIGLSTFAVNLLTLMVIAAGTDYAIFALGRYQEARGAGEDREQSYYTMFSGTAHVVLGSGLTIAGAMLCLSFTRLPYFQTMGVPCAIGTFVAVIAALTLGPAVITIGSRFGRFEPKRSVHSRGWRRVGVAVVRWPGPILAATIALALIGLVALPGYKTNYDARRYLPPDLSANVGYAAAERHFSAARMNPELLMIESDHDLRNPADFLVIDKIAKSVVRTPGISRVQTITRPDGTPIEHTTIPFMVSRQGTTNTMNEGYQQDRMADMLVQADEMQTTIDNMEAMQSITEQMAATTHSMVTKMQDMTLDVVELRDNIADFDDFLRPVRNYFYWEPHCFDIPGCWAIRSVFDTLDGMDTMTEDIQQLMPELAAGGFRERGLQARHQELHLTGRQVGAVHHQPRHRSGHPGGNRTRHPDQGGRQGGPQGHTAGGLQDFPGRHRRHLQGHARRCAVRPLDRGNRRCRTDFHHHADHHPRPGGSGGHRARIALDGVPDVGHSAAGRRIRLQPAAGVTVQGGTTGWPEDRDHPGDGGNRHRRHVGRSGVRRHDGLLRLQRPQGDGTGGYDHRDRPAVRHAGDPVLHDSRHRGPAGQVVLVAAGDPVARVRSPPAGT